MPPTNMSVQPAATDSSGRIINNDDHPDDQGLHADQEDHWGTQRASTADAAVGLANARENNKLSNNAVGNNQLSQHSVRSALGMRQRYIKENYN